jgi:hypothetical protein
MTTVTLAWDDPEDAARFLELRAGYRRHGWLPDPFVAELVELVADSTVVEDGSEEGDDDA